MLFFQVLRQLAQDVSYRSLVALGIASIHGLAVASFEKDDVERLIFFCNRQGKDLGLGIPYFNSSAPTWMRPPAPSRERFEMCHKASPISSNGFVFGNQLLSVRLSILD